MSTRYPIGTRVRIIADHCPDFEGGDLSIGRTGVIMATRVVDDDSVTWDYEVQYDEPLVCRVDPEYHWLGVCVMHSEVAPIIDPRAQQFIQWANKLQEDLAREFAAS